MLPKYPKVYTLGHRILKDIFLDPVIIQEKIDGSQISFGFVDGQLQARSRTQSICMDAPEKMFQQAVNTIRSIHAEYGLKEGYIYRGEYLRSPKHNTLQYSRIPKNHIIIFDINNGQESYLPVLEVADEAVRIGLEYVPTYEIDTIGCISEIQHWLDKESILGGIKIEGVAVKNYNRFNLDGHILVGKSVSEKFKEQHHETWRVSNPQLGDIIESIISSFNKEVYWQKAVQHLQEKGLLEYDVTDIGKLIKEAQSDILDEQREFICNVLMDWANPKIARGLIKGLPDWYKTKLAERSFEG